LPPFIRTFRVSFPRPRAGRICLSTAEEACSPAKVHAEPRGAFGVATSPGRVSAPKVPPNG
jgi:hypothetical protein